MHWNHSVGGAKVNAAAQLPGGHPRVEAEGSIHRPDRPFAMWPWENKFFISRDKMSTETAGLCLARSLCVGFHSQI